MIRFSTIIWLLLAGLVSIFIFFFFGFDNLDTWNRTIEIEDVSRIHVYKFEHKDISDPVSVGLHIEGEIDGKALVYATEVGSNRAIISSTNKACNEGDTTHFNIRKGKVNISRILYDYYQNVPGYIYYIPCGVKKGKLTIVWDM